MKDQITLKTKGKDTRTDIYIGLDLMQDPPFTELCKKLSRRLAIITDSQVGKHYGQPLLDFLEEAEFDVTLHTFKAGEKSKSRHTLESNIEDDWKK